MTTNLFDYPNVILGEEALKQGATTDMTIMLQLRAVLEKLVVERPLWRFVATHKNYNNRIETFQVMQDGEVLGSLDVVYYRGEHCVEVKNKRITDARLRSGGYRTKDTDKAIAAVKKMFSRKTITERIAQAVSDAGTTLDKLSRGKSRDQYQLANQLKSEASVFALGPGLTQFRQHLQNTNKGDWYERKEVVDSEMRTIEEAKKKFENNKTVLVVRTDGQYVVKTSGQVDVFDDNTLPEKYRAKIGMLKLVEDEEFVTSIGCRVNSETFVLLDEEFENGEQ